MKQFITILLISLTGLMACKDKKQTTEKIVEGEPRVTEVAANVTDDSAAIRKLITEFYNWYDKNYTKFQGYNLYSSIKKKELPPYKINWDEVEKYQQFIRTNVPQLGEEFMANQKSFFQQCDSAFKVDVNDDIPYGFDYDWYTGGQEGPEYLLENINSNTSTWNIAVNGDNADVAVTGFHDHPGKQERVTFISLKMKRENSDWKIAKIGID